MRLEYRSNKRLAKSGLEHKLKADVELEQEQLKSASTSLELELQECFDVEELVFRSISAATSLKHGARQRCGMLSSVLRSIKRYDLEHEHQTYQNEP